MSYGYVRGGGRSWLVALAVIVLAIVAVVAWYSYYMAAVAPPVPETITVQYTLTSMKAIDAQEAIPEATFIVWDDDLVLKTQVTLTGDNPSAVGTLEADYEDPYFWVYVSPNASYYLNYPVYVDLTTSNAIGNYKAYRVNVPSDLIDVAKAKAIMTLAFAWAKVANITLDEHPDMSIPTTVPSYVSAVNVFNMSEASELRQLTLTVKVNVTTFIPQYVVWQGRQVDFAYDEDAGAYSVVLSADLVNVNSTEATFSYVIVFEAEQAGAYTVTYTYTALNGLGEAETLATTSIVVS